jgi:DNA-binding LacI/PurR family transcriptional regulator
MYEMGRQAVSMLLDLLRGEVPSRLVTMPGDLVIRTSTAPASAIEPA